METKITFRTRFKFNGKEYDSVDAMPPEVREAYERAMSAVAHAGENKTPLVNIRTTTKMKIIFNGQEYASVDEMPPEIRPLYEAAIAAVKAEGGISGAVGSAANTMAQPKLQTPQQPTSFPVPGGNAGSAPNARTLILRIATLAVLIGWLVILLLRYTSH